MTRTTVYSGTPWDHDGDAKEVYDAFHNHDARSAVIIKTSQGQEIHIPEDEAIDIYIDGEEVEDA
ncbi:hypothetical protein [Halomarina litorea]|uniref:hypothetical protein n=1 Tax=Halomarina litorea TaxID=2961595 RepID=UPI0020C1EA64|nr:hypothetical protein [Halomarina sp. BCD28]